MEYIGQKEKKELAPQIKAVLKKYKMKGTIKINNHMTLVVTCQSGDLNFNENFVRNEQYLDVNIYHIDTWFTGTKKKFLQELLQAMKGTKWYDKSDAMTDYFDTAYYNNINIGTWDKPYKRTA